MRRELPEWWGTTETGSRAHLVVELYSAGQWALAACGQDGVRVAHAIGAPFKLPEMPWCKACLRAAESAAETVRAELAHLERIGVL